MGLIKVELPPYEEGDVLRWGQLKGTVQEVRRVKWHYKWQMTVRLTNGSYVTSRWDYFTLVRRKEKD